MDGPVTTRTLTELKVFMRINTENSNFSIHYNKGCTHNKLMIINTSNLLSFNRLASYKFIKPFGRFTRSM